LEAFLYVAFRDYDGRVLDPALADYFFVPHATTLVYHGSNFNSTAASCHLMKILNTVSQLPYAEKSAWSDHIVAWAHDSFGNNVNVHLPYIFRSNSIFIVNQGDDGTTARDFNMHTSIVTIPPSWHPPSEHVRPPWNQRTYLAVFRGSVLSDLKYSNGVRQMLDSYFKLHPDPSIIYGYQSDKYSEEMRLSKFCIFIKGWHVWSERLGTIINAKCIPVIISDHYSLPFSRNIDWSLFSLRIPMKDAIKPGLLGNFLRNISNEVGMELEANVSRIRHSLLYHLPPREGDVFDTILLELAQRKPSVKPISGKV